jgi:translation initiation factor 5B
MAKGKKKHRKGDASSEEDDEAARDPLKNTANGEKEDEEEVKKSKTQLKKEKKNKKKGLANKMQQQNQSEDDLDPLDPLAGGGGGGRFLSEEEEEKEEATMATKPKKKDKKKNNNNAMGGMASAFAMLMDEEEEAEEEAEEEELDKKDTKAKDKKKKKKKKKGFAGAIGFDDEDEDEDNDGEDGVVVIKEKKKSKKKIVSSDAKPYICVASIVEVGRHSMAENLKVCTVDYGRKKDARVVCGAPNLMAGMKIIFAPAGTKVPATDFEVEKQPLRGVMSDGMILSATDMGWEVDEDEDMDGVIELMDVSLQVGDEASGLEDKFGTSSTTFLKEKKEEQEAKEETEEAASSPSAPTGTSIQTPQDGDEDGNKTKPKDNKKNKKKKEKKKEAEEEDLDALLAELDIKPSEAPAAAGAAESESKAAKKRRKAAERAAAAEAGDDANGADGDDNDGEPKELTENQKKKLKKKQKEKEKKAALEAEKAKKAAEKPKSAAVLAMQQMMEKRKIEEAAEKERLEREKREAEEAAEREAQAEREAEEKRELKKQKEKEKKERLKAEGKLLSAKQKEEQKRMEAMRAQLLAKSGGVIPQAEKKLSYKEEQALKKKRFEEAKLAAIKKKEEEEKQKEQELLAAKAAANAKEKAEESDDAADDWEAEDWDEKNVLLPAQKEEQERLKKLEEERIRKEEAKALQAKKMAATNNKEKPWAKAAREKAKAKAAAAEVSTSSDASSDSDDSDSDSDSDSYSSDYSSSYYSSSEDEEERARLDHLAELRIQRLDRFEAKKAAATADKLRCPIICILGHVDTGKTKLLDNVRRTNVQDNEAGGITQQIGATFVPKQSLIDRTHSLNNGEFELNVPGLLVIDTPGHESFTNLRSRGSSLCDLAVLVVDIMHGLEPQTIESLNMLRNRKTPFVIALNKCDRMFDWEVHTDCPMQESLKKQKKFVAKEFETRSREVLLAFAEEGLNAALYWENPDPRTFVNVIPTSAHTGEGMPDLLHTLVHLSQSRLNERIRFIDSVQCTVLEVKMIEGLGTTMDIILINGTLKEGQTIVVAGLDGPIVTTIRALLTPQPLKEIRVKANYVHHKEIQGAQGIKIVANGLEKAIAGTAMLVKEVEEDDIEELKQDASNDVNNIMDTVDRSGHGVWVQASTLGSLEALLDFLKSPAVKIPVAGVALGPVNKRDVMGASVMHERKCPQYATILAFDVPVTDEAKKMCAELDVKLMTADIIYHLFDQFSAYMKEYREKQKEEQSKFVNFPCCLRIIESCVFNKRDPIVVGVDVLKGICRVGTQITIPSQNYIDIGKIESIELNKKSVDVAKAGQSVAIKIQPGSTEEGMRMYGRHFDHTDELVARMTRPSIEALKEFYRDEMQKDDWRLVVELKTKLEKFTGEPI